MGSLKPRGAKPAKTFYVYTLAEPDMDEFGSYEVFYVGKGCGKRIDAHEHDAHKGKRSPKCDRIRSIWATGKQVQKQIVFETDDEGEAYRYEMQLIANIGRETLTNGDDGGPFMKEMPRPHKKISLMNPAEYRNFLCRQGMDSEGVIKYCEKRRYQQLTKLETQLRAAHHNRRLNGWDTTTEIAQLEHELEAIYISVGCVFQEELF